MRWLEQRIQIRSHPIPHCHKSICFGLSSEPDAAQVSAAASRLAEELGLQASDTGVWKAQDGALSRLPEALVSAFLRTEQDFYTHSKVTAIICGTSDTQPSKATQHAAGVEASHCSRWSSSVAATLMLCIVM